MSMSAEMITKNVKGMVGVSFILSLVGAAIMWSQIREAENGLDTSQQDAANFHVFNVWTVFWVPLACAALYNSGTDKSNKVKQLATLRYFGFGIASAWISGSITPPTGALGSWADYSLGNLNALRISVERDGDNNAAPFPENAFWGNQPSEYAVPSNPELVLGALICAFIGGFMIYSAGSGSAAGMPFQGRMANRQLAGEKVLAPGMLTASMLGSVAMLLGMAAVFVLWTSDIAADPSNAMYGNVFTLIYAALFTGMNAFTGVIVEDPVLCEMALFSVGFFSLGAPVRLWQIEAFTEGAMTFNGKIDVAFDTVALENDLQRLRVGTVLIVLSGLASIWSTSAFLQSSYMETIAPGSTKRDDVSPNGMRKVLCAISGILVLTGSALLWASSNEALVAVGAENSARINSANFYIFLFLIAWLGMAAQLSGLNEVKSLPWVSFGIATASMIGFLNIGTHDRQLWFLDYTLSGINELHQYLYADEGVFPAGGRSDNITEDSKMFEMALAGLICGLLSANFVIMATLDIPSKFTRKDTWVETSGSSAKLVGAIVVFAIIGMSCLLAAPSAAVPLSQLNTSQAACNWLEFPDGSSKNLFCWLSDGVSGYVPAGERFTLNTYDPMAFVAETDQVNTYTVAFTFSTLGLFVAFWMLNGLMSESIRSVKLAIFMAGFLWLSLSWVFVGGNAGEETDHQYTAGIVFLWLETGLALVAGAMFLTKEDDAFLQSQEGIEKAPTNIEVVPAAARAAQSEQVYGVATTAV